MLLHQAESRVWAENGSPSPSLETKVSQGLQDVAAAPGVPMLGGEVAAEALLAVFVGTGWVWDTTIDYVFIVYSIL